MSPNIQVMPAFAGKDFCQLPSAHYQKKQSLILDHPQQSSA
jgi:hypothetical protein